MKGIDINSLILNVRLMYYDEGIVPSGLPSVDDDSVTVRGSREGVYKYDGRWYRATTLATTKGGAGDSQVRTRLRITVCDADNPRASKSYTAWVTLGMPQEKGVSHAAVMNCVKDFKTDCCLDVL